MRLIYDKLKGLPDRVAGVLLGLAAGDRNGGPIQMAIRLAQSLDDLRRFDKQDVGRRYLEWWNTGGFDTGPVTERVFELCNAGETFQRASERVHEETHGMTAGCNPAHRIGPLAMLTQIPDEDLPGIAKVEAALTHQHPLAGDVSAAVACLCRALIRGDDWPEACETACYGRMPETKKALNRNNAKDLSSGGYSPDALAASIYFVNTSPCFNDALDEAIRFAGPANFCPVLVGAIAGARWGASAIPDNAISHLEGKTVIHIKKLGENLINSGDALAS